MNSPDVADEDFRNIDRGRVLVVTSRELAREVLNQLGKVSASASIALERCTTLRGQATWGSLEKGEGIKSDGAAGTFVGSSRCKH